MLKENLRPEFLNRMDEKVMFLPLTKDEIKQIAGLMIKNSRRIWQNKRDKYRIRPKRHEFIGGFRYDPQFGARPMARVIKKRHVNDFG